MNILTNKQIQLFLLKVYEHYFTNSYNIFTASKFVFFALYLENYRDDHIIFFDPLEGNLMDFQMVQLVIRSA